MRQPGRHHQERSGVIVVNTAGVEASARALLRQVRGGNSACHARACALCNRHAAVLVGQLLNHQAPLQR